MKSFFRLFLFPLLCLVILVNPAWGKVTVTRDNYGIPFILADTEEELFEEFGYVTAVDRLWQIEVNKRWAKGKLAEIFGGKLVPADMQARLTGYSDAEYLAIFEQMSGHSQILISAYLKGVNRRVNEVNADPNLLPMEYLALKLKPTHFTTVDVLAFTTELLRRFGQLGGAELSNLAALQNLTARLGQKEGWSAFQDWCWINDPSAPTYIKDTINGDFVPGGKVFASAPKYLEWSHAVANLSRERERLSIAANREASRIGAPVKMGSYAWTLSPEVTGTGFPILVGQPQIGLSTCSVPFMISEFHLKGGRLDIVGMVFPLMPFIPIGHNRYLAWSHMVGMCDNVDVYQEVLNPLNREQYLYQGKWEKMGKRTEEIAVAGGETKKMTIYHTIHGPVVSPFPFDPRDAKVNHVYTNKSAHWMKEPLNFEAWFQMMIATNAEEFEKGVAQLNISLHTIYADIKGNIGYWHTGLNPERAKGFDPRLPLPGTGEGEWTGRYLPNAQALNPSKGFICGWNNKASPDTRNPFDTIWKFQCYGRFHRVLWLERALSGKKGLDKAKNKEIMRYVGGAGTFKYNKHNAFGAANRDILPFVARAVSSANDEDKRVLVSILKVLESWDGRSVNDVLKDDKFQAGQTIFVDWVPRVLQATFGDEFEGIEKFDKPLGHRIFSLFLRCLEGPVSSLPVSRNYFDDIRTPKEESLEDIFLKSLIETASHFKETFQTDDSASWQAPRTKFIFKHSLFGKVGEMWDNNIGGYIMIVELRPEGALGYSRWPTGQSGNVSMGPDKKPVFDPHFLDMLPLFRDYTYQKMGLD
ncbi:MAG: penicillin acylase family protein [Desulfobacteraceae bacterium]|nr:penicillin acylase family protein [Desulfobacteraceae bacterium]